MLMVKKLSLEEAVRICPAVIRYEKDQHRSVFHRMISEADIENDSTPEAPLYVAIDEDNNQRQLIVPSGAKKLSDLDIRADEMVVGVNFTHVSLFTHTLPYPVYNQTGKYLTRSGKEIVIDKVRPHITYSMSGYIPTIGKKPPVWTVWTKYGEIISGNNHADDIVDRLLK